MRGAREEALVAAFSQHTLSQANRQHAERPARDGRTTHQHQQRRHNDGRRQREPRAGQRRLCQIRWDFLVKIDAPQAAQRPRHRRHSCAVVGALGAGERGWSVGGCGWLDRCLRAKRGALRALCCASAAPPTRRAAVQPYLLNLPRLQEPLDLVDHYDEARHALAAPEARVQGCLRVRSQGRASEPNVTSLMQ